MESGTYDYFTEAIVGEAKASRSNYTAQRDDDFIVRGAYWDCFWRISTHKPDD